MGSKKEVGKKNVTSFALAIAFALLVLTLFAFSINYFRRDAIGSAYEYDSIDDFGWGYEKNANTAKINQIIYTLIQIQNAKGCAGKIPAPIAGYESADEIIKKINDAIASTECGKCGPILEVTPNQLEFFFKEGDQTPEEQTISIRNTGAEDSAFEWIAELTPKPNDDSVIILEHTKKGYVDTKAHNIVTIKVDPNKLTEAKKLNVRIKTVQTELTEGQEFKYLEKLVPITVYYEQHIKCMDNRFKHQVENVVSGAGNQESNCQLKHVKALIPSSKKTSDIMQEWSIFNIGGNKGHGLPYNQILAKCDAPVGANWQRPYYSSQKKTADIKFIPGEGLSQADWDKYSIKIEYSIVKTRRGEEVRIIDQEGPYTACIPLNSILSYSTWSQNPKTAETASGSWAGYGIIVGDVDIEDAWGNNNKNALRNSLSYSDPKCGNTKFPLVKSCIPKPQTKNV